MRQLELKVRKQMDIAVGAKAAGLEDMRTACQTRIDNFGKMYTSLSEASGIPRKTNRMWVEGFTRWKNPKANEIKRLNCMKPLNDLKSQNPLALELHEGRQGKHIKGHPNHVDSKSEVTISMGECRQIIYDKSGTGTLVWNKKGLWTNKERVVADKIIGTVTDKDGNKIETNKAMIHYSKKGAHLVPRKD